MKRYFLLSAMAVFALFSCQRADFEADSPVTVTETAEKNHNLDYISGTVNVQFTEDMAASVEEALTSGSFVGTKACGFADLQETLGIESIVRLFPDAGEYEARHREAGLHRWYRVDYSREVARTKAEADLSALDGVTFVSTPVEKVPAQFDYFNDTYAYMQWHYYNDGTLVSGFKSGADINVIPVWENYTTGDSNVIVGVVDTGVQLDHYDLSANIDPQLCHCFVYGREGDVIEDTNHHGTHVSGTISAINNNGIGVCGIAGGNAAKGVPGVTIMNCQIFKTEGTETLQGNESQAIVWAADHGAVILNNSWGVAFSSTEDARRYMEAFEAGQFMPETKAAIDYFIKNAGMSSDGTTQTGPMAGGLLFFAAGNEAVGGGVPAGYSKVVAVGAFGPTGKSAYYTNYGDWVDIAAPGGDANVDYSKGQVYSTAVTNIYGGLQGTSMACPHAVGVAALLVSHMQGPGLTADRVRELMLLGAKRGFLSGVEIGPKLDAYRAFQAVNYKEPVITAGHQGDIEVKAHETKTFKYSISNNESDQYEVLFSSSDSNVTAEVSSSEVTVTIDGMLFDEETAGSFNITVAKGIPGYEAEETVKFTVLANHAPEVKSRMGDIVMSGSTGAESTFVLDNYFTDPDGETLNYAITVDGSAATAGIKDGELYVSAVDYGTVTVTVTASDRRDAKVTQEFNVLLHNAASDIDVYPNPVSETLYVRPAAEGKIEIVITNQFGTPVYSGTSDGGPFSPVKIDVRDYNVGRYTVEAESAGKSVSVNIMKY